MKLSFIFAALLTIATAVSASPTPTTNAKRMAEGLPPLPPTRRSNAVRAAPSVSLVPRA
ncbi:hypothetical protein C8J55DRAFT_564880 [Lentinula edodes]|uniref:Uncharacterized protein n=1 Tax=Lentinula lateritia TaxID=40482 RepID=A0A9W9DGG8_9AGAR|nr:uncharacterized protein C8R40DRAFT_1176074 [Lentinula edodes]KAF8829542.1 hypothetical protein HHX47_DHR3000442 [Lentinula edodes]KAH7869960.1 hypothetical protein C8R40DRAFT_1176074 [Lentinula edodes]KAJ4468378.1 hypothetical protein C8J55DRAFT_564880 [Lentinula edodes]